MGDRKYLTAERKSRSGERGDVAELASDARWPGFRQNREAVLHPVDQLEAWDKNNTIWCRAVPQDD
jgi:hypothetical protein